jgi:outer membrane autotransporter protein
VNAVLASNTVSANGVSYVLQSYANNYAANGSTGNAQLDSAVLGLGLYSSQQGLAAAAETLTPASLASGQQASMATRQLSQVIDKRRDYLQASAGIDVTTLAADRYLWVQPIGSQIEQQRQDHVAGYDLDASGLIIGADGKLADNLEAGVALAYITSDIDGDRNLGGYDNTIDSYQLGVYSTLHLGDNRVLKAQLALGQSEYDVERQLFDGQQSKADFSGWQAGVDISVEQHIALSDRFELVANAGIVYDYVDLDSYREKGAGVLSLSVDGDNYDSLVTKLGVQANYALTDNWLLLAEGSLGYDALASEQSLKASFANGDQFVTDGISPEPWVYNTLLGAKYNTRTGHEITAFYQLGGREHFTEQTVGVNLRWMF